MSWDERVSELLNNNEYGLIAQWYEKQVESEPDKIDNYWYLGLSYLLDHQEESAQMTWFLALSGNEAEENQQSTDDLIRILDQESIRQENLKQYDLSWLIRAHIREIQPDNLLNLLYLSRLDIYKNGFDPDTFPDEEILSLLENNDITPKISEALLQNILNLFSFVHPKILLFAESCFPYINRNQFLAGAISFLVDSGCQYKNPSWGIALMNLCLKLEINTLYIKYILYNLYSLGGFFEQSLTIANELEQDYNNIIAKIYFKSLIILTLLRQGKWSNIANLIEEFKELIYKFSKRENDIIDEAFLKEDLFSAIVPLKYYEDDLNNQLIQNELARIFQEQLPLKHAIEIDREYPRQIEPDKKIRIGYIGNTLKRHSVGWLSRWLIYYHDRSRFQIHIYLMNQNNDDITLNWFQRPEDKTYNFHTIKSVVKQIQSDAIDILVDLDSVTSSINCQVMALKPAPVQITWLGYDASGIPAVDYFIADNYSLPENAQDYYREKIWRLPHSYLSVDGFEVGIPNLRRDKLGIPEDGIIYLSSQTGLKRHPDTIRSQMRILAGVPNSYLLVKGLGDSQTIQAMFRDIALEEGVSPERLRFLAIEASEEIHRANLSIADVVLDTYPYGGATTTLEVLWMGIPLVTRVGQQFPARNSYTFMVNAGISEGITWSEAEYVEWGIKLGTDAELRQQVREKLRLSKKLSPLWNARRFTLDVESAYREMWREYCTQKRID